MNVVHDKLPAFKKSAYAVLDDALKEGARDILIGAKTTAPFKKGALRGGTDITSPAHLKKRISFWTEYARYQELGGDAKHKVRNYSTPGTGAHYLKNAGDKIAKSMHLILKKHAKRARA